MAEKVRENRLRDTARRRGLTLTKSRRRDPEALGYGTYMLTDTSTGAVVAAGESGTYGLSLDQVEEFLSGSRS